jgi:hypothetical protein
MTYRRVRLLGRGGTAEVWLARDETGDYVALKPATPEAAAVTRAAAALAHPNVLGLLGERDGTLVLPYVAGGSLAAALAGGAAYAPPQAAALGAALADALAAAHAAGLVHGDVKPGNVLLAGPGEPLLADFRGVGSPADDTRSLAALVTTLAPSLAPLPEGDVAALRDHLRGLDLPVDGVDPEPTRDFGPRPPAAAASPAPARRATARPAVRLAAAAAVAIAVAVVAGWSLPRATNAGALAPPSAASPSPAEPDWRTILAALDDARSAAFTAGDPRALDAAYAPGSPAGARDRALLAAYARRHQHVTGLHLVADDVRAESVTGTSVTLHVRDRLLPYSVVDAQGRPVARWPGRGAAEWRVTLARGPTGWRIVDVARASAAPS